MFENEYITCAAIWYKNLPTMVHLPKNITIGVVIAGHRHPNVINALYTIANIRTVGDGYVQGFLTSKNRFVDRAEAAQIALEAKQIKEPKKELFSEDIY